MFVSAFSYFCSCFFVLLAHGAMLCNVFFNGKYSDIMQPIILSIAVAGLDLTYFVILPLFRQKSYTVDLVLLLLLNMSVIFQSCFGGVHLSLKHYITCVVSLAACRGAFLMCRNYKWLQMKKVWIYAAIGVLMVVIVTLTGSRSMWISIGSMSIQPSEFIKPLFILACATSVSEQQKKHKIAGFYIVYENFSLYGLIIAICGLQWWCRDLGSLPTFAAIFASGFLLRICYPKAKFSKNTLIFAGVGVLIVALIAIKLAPAYVQERLFADIWNDQDGAGYQQSQALIAIADGGWFGKGPGYGALCHVFAHENDIVFSTICEEWGLLFGLMMVLAILIMAAVPLVDQPRSYYHGTMAAGVCAAFTVQMGLNIFGSCNMIPFTGVTIPFISAGGSSLAVSGIMAGMLAACLSPDMKNPKKYKQTLVPVRRQSA